MEVGFIILRHVNNSTTNEYWKKSYSCIRKHYPENHILIIDDNSNYDFITPIDLHKTTIVNSEFPGRGELLPYIYYLKYKLFDIAVIIHDSVFINNYIDFTVTSYKFIWHFEGNRYDEQDEMKMLKTFNNKRLLIYHLTNKNRRKGCFGGMSVITHNYLTFINNTYNLSNLIPYITTRHNRCSFERVIACILQFENGNHSLLGNIHGYIPWGITFGQEGEYNHLPLVKVWTGR